METKIIKAVFGGSRYTVTAKRTRTDYGQVLEISGVDLPSTFECIFSNSDTSAGVGKKMIGSAQRVLIPDEYLTTGQTIYAWILLHDGEDDGRHMYNVKIPVADMPNLSPEEPTPVEQSVISQAITALNSAVDTTSQKAQEASASADRAEQAAEGVEGYAERAESAQQAAENARDRATQAETSARTSAATATEKASEAISSATTASQSALTAESASESAQEYATASAESASQASQSADTASESASASAGNANFAASKALDASNSASEAAKSASTATQAKTDAETAKTASETAQGLAETARNEAVSAKTDAESARDAAAQSASEAAASASQAAESARTLIADPTLTQSGQAADAKKTGDEITSLKADIDGIKRHTKNLADIYSYTGGGISLSNGVFVGTGGAFNGAEFVFNGNANTQYRVSFDAKTGGNSTTSGSGLKFRLHYTDDTASSWRIFANSDTSYTHYSLYSAEGKTIDKLQWSLSTGVSNIWYVKNLQIELGTVETTYEYPYTARDKKSESEIAKTNLNVNSVVNQLINATNSGYQADIFELGNISIGESGWTYSNSTTRIGTKEGATIHLNEGDVIGLTSYANARYYLGWITSDSTYGYVGWLTRDWTISTTGDYVILLCHASDTTLSDKNELLQLLFIKHRGVRKSLYEIPWYNRSGMRLHAHRGLIDSDPTSDYVENSIPSFERAGKNHMFICETDLNVTSDGHFVCMHDGTVDRTTNGSGNVSDMTLAQVRALRLLKKDGTTSNLLVPTLEEYLTICRQYNMVALFEIKGYTGAKVSSVMEIVKKYGMKHQCCIAMSYANMRSLRILTNLDVPAFIIATDSTWSDCYDTARAYDYTGISYSSDGTITQAMIQDCHDNDIPFDVWVANTVASADNYFDLGVDIVTTDILTPSDWLE